MVIFVFSLFNNILLGNTIVNASADTLATVSLGGDSIGLSINTNVYVTGKYELELFVNGKNIKIKPWEDSNIEVYDEILYIDNNKVSTIDDLKKIINEEKEYNLVLKRGSQTINTTIKAYKYKDSFQLGLFVKDNVVGVGTMTYYDLKTKKFASLGHQAINTNIRNGFIKTSYVNGIVKGMRGNPGEKKATILNEKIGTIELNNEFGVFGTLDNLSLKNDLIKIGKSSSVHTGKAEIVTVINGSNKETFDIEIIEAKSQTNKDVKGIKFEVVDEDLLSKTGGIIQGMSGSPIIQDGKLIGAVSHVLVDDSKVGFGVYSEFMLAFT